MEYLWLIAGVLAALAWRLFVKPALERLPQPEGKDTLRGMIGFCRPHTVKGTILASTSGYALLSMYHGEHAYMALILVLLSGILANVFIVGVNQLVDIEIDKINEKNLPLVTGELSFDCARKITARTLVLAVTVAFFQSTVWGLTISAMCLIGIVYSVPPMRLKRFAVPAALCIVLARAILGTIGGVYTYTAAMGKTVDEYMQYHLTVFRGILIAFTTVIALMKDVPDIEGDRREGVRSLSVVMGPQAVSNICFAILSCMYVVVIGLSWQRKAETAVFSHLYGLIWLHMRLVSGPSKATAMWNYFSVVWPLFYYEFAAYLLPIALEQFGKDIGVEVLAFILGTEIAYLKFGPHAGCSQPGTSASLNQTIKRKSGLDIASLVGNLNLRGSESVCESSDKIAEAATEMSVALSMHAKFTKLSGKAYRDAKKLAILCGDWLLARAVIALCETKNQKAIHEMGKSIMAATQEPEEQIGRIVSEFSDNARVHVVSS
jgi:homogentisate phytyltransferase/homogentisate geranylgeranyltransferase